MSEGRPGPRDLDVDRLPDEGSSLEVVLLHDQNYGADSDWGARRPHRHDYHELIWTRRGAGQHRIDGEVTVVRPNSATLIGRGRVHVFERASGLDGAIVRFGDEMLSADRTGRANPAWLLGTRGARTIDVPPDEAGLIDATVTTLAAEAGRAADSRSIDVERHLLSALLLWFERWHEAEQPEGREADDPDLQLHRRFTELLEQDFPRHHDTKHYADRLGVPQAMLSRTLSAMTGHGTKELITERRMLEAVRLLRFTDLSIGEVAFRAGFEDQLYFSRAFKRYSGEAPVVYRDRVRGRTGTT